MLNCPAANAKPAAPSPGSSSKVKMSCVSGRTPTTRYGRGSIGSGTLASPSEGPCRAAAPLIFRLSRRNPIDVQQLQARSFQALHDNLGEALQELIAQVVVFFTLGPEAFAVQGQGPHQGDGAGIEVPAVGVHQ